MLKIARQCGCFCRSGSQFRWKNNVNQNRKTGKHLCFGAFPHLSRIKIKFPSPLRHFWILPCIIGKLTSRYPRFASSAISPHGIAFPSHRRRVPRLSAPVIRLTARPIQRNRRLPATAHSPRSFTLREQTSADIFRYFLSPRRLRTPPPRQIYMQWHRCSARRSQVSHARRARRSA